MHDPVGGDKQSPILDAYSCGGGHLLAQNPVGGDKQSPILDAQVPVGGDTPCQILDAGRPPPPPQRFFLWGEGGTLLRKSVPPTGSNPCGGGRMHQGSGLQGFAGPREPCCL